MILRELDFRMASWQFASARITRNPELPELAHLGLGRAYAIARRHRPLWKDADPDIPILIAAKSECAQLK